MSLFGKHSHLHSRLLRVVVCGMAFVALLIAIGCSSTRHVAPGNYLLDKVSVVVDSQANLIDRGEMLTYVRQQPNHRMLWSMRFRLGIYNMSGHDTTRWWNRWIRKLGEPPVIYDSLLTQISMRQLQQALENKGFLNAQVWADTIADHDKRKMKVDYHLIPGTPRTIAGINYEFDDDSLRSEVMRDSVRFPVRIGDPLDRSLLENQRDYIVRRLRNRGYFTFSKDQIRFIADTTAGSYAVDLTMRVERQPTPSGSRSPRIMQGAEVADAKYLIRRVVYITNFDAGAAMQPGDAGFPDADCDTVYHKGIEIIYGKKHYLRPSVLYENTFLRPGELFRQRNVDRTYNSLSRLDILDFINIRFVPAGHIDNTGLLDAYILLTPGKSQSFSLELEGTNSEGDLGVALGLSYSHRNVGHGSETLTTKVRGAYEALNSNLSGLINDRYMEYSVDLGLKFPKFKAPFLKERFKRRINATTDISLSVNYQERPEYTRVITTAGWNYRWTERATRNRHTLTPIDVNYVYLPRSTYNFINNIAPDNPLLRYSYEDHFIMRLGYSFYHTNKRPESLWRRSPQKSIYTVRVNAETAGNLLFAISSIFRHRPNFHTAPYKVFGIHYSQYFKAEADFALMRIIDHRNSLAFHAGFGIAVPYGNSGMVPFEKRFYGGGANGVRGWDVRTLGPGSFPGTNNVSDFINQCGDIRLDLSLEYRAKLFWVIELGLFVDAGNIWTIRDYQSQPGGAFRFDSFAREIAGAYGAGLRLDFNYFLLRFDLGMKAHNPAKGEIRWPIIHPNWHRDSSFHFSIGYPF